MAASWRRRESSLVDAAGPPWVDDDLCASRVSLKTNVHGELGRTCARVNSPSTRAWHYMARPFFLVPLHGFPHLQGSRALYKLAKAWALGRGRLGLLPPRYCDPKQVEQRTSRLCGAARGAARCCQRAMLRGLHPAWYSSLESRVAKGRRCGGMASWEQPRHMEYREDLA